MLVQHNAHDGYIVMVEMTNVKFLLWKFCCYHRILFVLSQPWISSESESVYQSFQCTAYISSEYFNLHPDVDEEERKVILSLTQHSPTIST